MKVLRFAALALAVLISACSPAKDEAAAPADGKTTIRFATDWRAQAEHGGFYQALATGEYAKRGLDVQIVQGGPGVNVPQLLASGAVEAGMGSNSFIVMNLAQEGVPVKAVAAIMQKDPQVLIAHPDQGIESISDLKGRPILLSDASVTAFWVWLKSKYGFTDDQVRKYTFNAAPFLADKRAAQQGYVTSEPYTIEKEAGIKPKVFLLADEGYPGYATMILVPESLIAKNPAAVKAVFYPALQYDKAVEVADAPLLHDGLNLAERIRRLANGRATLDVAQFQFIGLAEIRARYGERWSEKRDRVNQVARHFISRRIAPDDVLVTGADGFLLVFGAFSGFLADAAAQRIAKELNVYFLGDPDLDDMQVGTQHHAFTLDEFKDLFHGTFGYRLG